MSRQSIKVNQNKWTKTPPTEVGWYWFREGHQWAIPVHISEGGWRNCVVLGFKRAEENYGKWWPEKMEYPPGGNMTDQELAELCIHGVEKNRAFTGVTGGIILTCTCCNSRFGYDQPGAQTLCGACRLVIDTELADRIIAFGLGRKEADGHKQYQLYGAPIQLQTAYGFVQDWRVAGACLERWPTTINVEHLDMTLDEMLRDPRAIIEAYAEAFTPAPEGLEK